MKSITDIVKNIGDAKLDPDTGEKKSLPLPLAHYRTPPRRERERKKTYTCLSLPKNPS